MMIHMKQKTLLMGILLTVSGIAAAQNDGGISAQMLQQLEKAHAATPQQKALFNAIAANPIDDLTKNFANQGAFDTSFSVETPKQSIHDQKSSGRCWMFSGLNVLRANFAKRHNDTLAVALAGDLELGAERARTVCTSQCVLVENLTARRLLSVKALAVVTGIARNLGPHRSLFLGCLVVR